MIRLTVALWLGSAALTAQQAVSPERQFDFWIGEWNVNNRLLGGEGWYDAGAARARIRPILGGKAILEEWAGQPGGGHAEVFGISVRYFDSTKRRWIITLNWPNAEQASFTGMEGSFRHGRAEFFPPTAVDATPPRATRFTFSDALADTVRWDMAQPIEGGGWRTAWIMEFSRARSAVETIGDGEPIRRPPPVDRCVCKDPDARQFDALVGAWSGAGWLARGPGGARQEVQATLRVTSTSRGCATLCFLEVVQQTPFGRQAESRFEAWAFDLTARKWIARALDGRTPESQRLIGTFDAAGAGTFVRNDRPGKAVQPTRRVCYEPAGDGKLKLRHEASEDSGKTWAVRLELDLTISR